VEEQFLGRKTLVQDVRDIRTWIPQLMGPLQDTNLPYTSTSWDGDAYSTTAKTVIDLSAVFGAPANMRAVDLWVQFRDSGSAAGDPYLVLWCNDTALEGKILRAYHIENDAYVTYSLMVPCDANGDIYYQINATGASTMDVWMQIHGYWL